VVLAALCFAAINPPTLPLVRIDSQFGAATSCAKMTDETFVVSAAGSSYWHVFNQEGLYAVDRERLELVQYQHCPWYQTRAIDPGVDS